MAELPKAETEDSALMTADQIGILSDEELIMEYAAECASSDRCVTEKECEESSLLRRLLEVELKKRMASHG